MASPKIPGGGPATHIDIAPGPHVDTQIPPAVNIGRHIDTPGGPHIDSGGAHADVQLPKPAPHVDVTMPHVDTAVPPHGDANQHIDTPGGPHADTPTTPHIDVSIPHVPGA